MTIVDVITGTVVLASAGCLLVRSLRKSVQGCGGCGGACGKGHASQAPVVQLRRRGALSRIDGGPAER